MRADRRRENRTRRVSRTLLGLSLLCCVVTTSTGCRLCCDREDQAYSAYGGIWERTQRNSGRVGSLFDPGGARTADVTPRDSAKDDLEARERVAPLGGVKSRGSDGDPLPEPVRPERKSDEETEQEFQERLRKFQEEKMLNAGIVPGEPAPPDFR
ncbi:hypothetical protein Mal15_40120 [Stieleria maiorica]|uniref:Uncharacterized protein n=1 Tax=Stieleria maiorica TaxID=2795974 RepID=A0A5B9MJZ9_9BACT|nr:hypothetical protein [Stieleria maiorica]QEF99945.1 hypothetical protein Mal15_40120 [Stieleria maiorica]